MESKDISHLVGKKVNITARFNGFYATLDNGELRKEGELYFIMSRTQGGAAAVSFPPSQVDYYRNNSIYIS